MKRALIVTSVASMIKQFNIPNIKLLQELGYEVTVATNFSEPGTMPKKAAKELLEQLIHMDVTSIDINFYRQPFSRKNLKAYHQIKSVIKIKEFDIIHCQSPIGGALTRLAARTARRKGTKVIYTAHGFHFYEGAPMKNWILFYPVEKVLSKFTDILITINQEDYKRSQSFNAKSVYYVPGVGIDLEKYQNNSTNRILNRKDSEIDKDCFTIVSVGELNKNKNHQIVIRALKKIENENYVYIICGVGPKLEELKKLVDESDLNKKVQFVGFRNDINKILQASNLFVFPSYREGLSLALMEAMAIGLPAIVSNIRGNTDLIDDSKGGFLFNIDNPDELADKIKMMINNKEKAKNLGVYNSKKIENFSLENVLLQMSKIYSEKLLK